MAGVEAFKTVLEAAGASSELEAYAAGVALFLVTLALLYVFKFFLLRRLRRLAAATASGFDDVLLASVDAVAWPFYVAAALYVGAQVAPVGATLGMALYYILLVVGVYYAVKVVSVLVEYWLEKVAAARAKEKDEDTTPIDLVRRFFKVALWVVAGTLLLSNLGYDVSTLIAGVGVAGIVIGFALQNVLSDLFASFTIYFDRPFRTGDYIVVGDDAGTVQRIGLKSTRLQTLRGEELVISNRALTDARIHNFKKMKKRRIAFSFGVEYETPVEKVRKIPSIVRAIIEGMEHAEPSRVHFKAFGDSALEFEVVYYMKVPDYDLYMDTQQAINLALMQRFEEEGIAFAYPTQKVFLEKLH